MNQSAFPELDFIRAKTTDAKLLFDWRNDPVTRENAHQSEPLVWEDHHQWFEKVLIDMHREIYIVKLDGNPVASIRRDQHQGHWLISVMVSPAQRGKGIAKKLLWQFVRKYSDIYLAEIKHENIPSIKAFQGAGFCLLETLLTHQVWKYVPDESASR